MTSSVRSKIDEKETKKTRSVENTLEQRGAVYGDYKEESLFIVQIRDIMEGQSGWKKLSPTMRCAIEMIVVKLTRIIIGNPKHKDNWHDIGGYSKLAEDSIKNSATDGPVARTMYKIGDRIPYYDGAGVLHILEIVENSK